MTIKISAWKPRASADLTYSGDSVLQPFGAPSLRQTLSRGWSDRWTAGRKDVPSAGRPSSQPFLVHRFPAGPGFFLVCVLSSEKFLQLTRMQMDFNPVASFPVPDAPQNLQLSLHREVEGVIMGHWAPPVHTHGLIREYIVSSSQVRAVRCG